MKKITRKTSKTKDIKKDIKKDLTKDLTKDIKKTIKKDIKKEVPVEFIDSGSTMLNLALSGKGKSGGWARGRIVNIVAKGSVGKSLAALEAGFIFNKKMKKNVSINFPKVKESTVVYNNTETVMDFPVASMYGQDFVDEVVWKNIPTVEETGRDFANLVINLKKGNSLLYIIDSWDSLKSEESIEAFLKAAKENKKKKAGFNLEKQAYGTQDFFPNICTVMKRKDATLMIISQARPNVGVVYGPKYIRTGGDALNYYTHQVAWFKLLKEMKKIVRGREKPYGTRVGVDVRRSKVSIPYNKAEFNILFNHGFDDIPSMLSWYFGPEKKITEEEINIFSVQYDREKTNRTDIISFIEDNNLEVELQDIVEKEWIEIEKAVQPHRKSKF